MMLDSFALGCPDCGFFVRGVDIHDALAILGEHRQAFLCTEDAYNQFTKAMFDEADQAVTT